MTVSTVPIPLIDGARTRRIVELLVILWVLALCDLFFTIWAHIFTPFCELNPLPDEHSAELRKPFHLPGKAVVDRLIRQRSVGRKLLVDGGNEYAIGEGVRVAIAEDHLHLLDGPQPAPHARGDADKRRRLAV